MDRIPQELVDQICNCLSAEDLPNVYSVSQAFRKAAGEKAGRYRTRKIDLKLKMRESFIQEYSGFRLRYIQEISFVPMLQDLEIKAGFNCHESPEELRQNDELFTDQIRQLFAILKAVEVGAREDNPGRYRLIIYSPSQAVEHTGAYCYHRDHVQWYTRLKDPGNLPELPSVTALRVANGGYYKKTDYRIMIDLATRFPNLEYLECRLGDGEWPICYDEEPASLYVTKYDGPRRDTRHGLAQAVSSTRMPKSLQVLELDFFGTRDAMAKAEEVYPWMATPNLVHPEMMDPFSNSLRVLSYPLKIMRIRAQVDETLFWPGEGTPPTWPNLNYVFVMFHMVAPSGAWYFEGPRGQGGASVGHEIDESSYPPLENNEEDRWEDQDDEAGRSWESRHYFWFRISPNEKVLVPFLESFAKAATNMPELKQAMLWSPLRWDFDGGSDDRGDNFTFDYMYSEYQALSKCYDDVAWGLAYTVCGLPCKMLKVFHPSDFNNKAAQGTAHARQLWWKVGDWRPSPELHDLFHQIGRLEHGDSLREDWDVDEPGKGLLSRELFDIWPEY